MLIGESLRSSFRNIFSHKLRSALTLLGITIGVFAVVTMFSTIYGVKKMIGTKMGEMGWNNSLIIYPSNGEQATSHRRRRRFFQMKREAKPLTISDFQYLKKEVNLKHIYGYIENWQTFYVNQKKKNIKISATNNDFFHTKTYKLKSGRFFNSFEETTGVKVCILGFYFAEKYFKNENPIGKILTFGKNRFQVVGVLNNDELNQNGMNFNNWERKWEMEAVYIPLSTGSAYFRSKDAIDYIYLQSFNDGSFQKMKTQTTQKLLAKHNMAHDFSFNDVGAFMMKITKEIDDVMQKWNVTLFAIASISLIVGGIGLFSTLLISINERMKEIGVRKSIGATELDIFLHFLFEAVILSLMGAFAGIIVSSLLVKLVSIALKMSLPVPMAGVILGLGFAVIIGIISGLYPALKASKIDPIKAIFYFE
ncbi:MAG: FtsX-like permease family protein [Candidatus Cloacimonetes bacterium]|jgi:putative ABC transport system permease protein|nr:FtsX-like permease family protein [Candidatus Cloacimonadota bacterium]MBT6993367.1 FtsX-like permease family protein [Candidatus Cloacimonadota bacterium]MBT7469325.1 FtsX-like permease family protein [Candidatus Cloacimonadota bacterium]